MVDHKELVELLIIFLDQNINNWEAFIIGDGCPHFQQMINSGEVREFQKIAEKNGNILNCFNWEYNAGFWGYEQVNYAIEKTSAKYHIFCRK